MHEEEPYKDKKDHSRELLAYATNLAKDMIEGSKGNMVGPSKHAVLSGITCCPGNGA